MTRGARLFVGAPTPGFSESRRSAQSRGGAGGGLAAQPPNVLAGGGAGGRGFRPAPSVPSAGAPPPSRFFPRPSETDGRAARWRFPGVQRGGLVRPCADSVPGFGGRRAAVPFREKNRSARVRGLEVKTWL